MKNLLLVTLVSSVAMVGCASKKPVPAPMPHHHHHHAIGHDMPTSHHHSNMTTENFECDNGITTTVVYGNDMIHLTTHDGYKATMNIARAGSGNLYVAKSGLYGTGGEWHIKSYENSKTKEVDFSYRGVHGNLGHTTCYAR